MLADIKRIGVMVGKFLHVVSSSHRLIAISEMHTAWKGDALGPAENPALAQPTPIPHAIAFTAMSPAPVRLHQSNGGERGQRLADPARPVESRGATSCRKRTTD